MSDDTNSMGKVVVIVDNNFDISSLQIACVKWLKLEATRIAYFVENVPGGSALSKRILIKPAGFDVFQTDALCATAINAIESGNLETAKHTLLILQKVIKNPMDSNDISGGKEYNRYLDRLISIFNTDQHSTVSRKRIISLWFEMIHSWRGESSKGVPAIPDLSRFMVMEWLATVFLLGLGVVVPTLKSETGGIYQIVPFMYFVLMCAVNAVAGLAKDTNMRLLYFWVGNALGFIPAVFLQDDISRWILWSWAGGAIVGVLIGNHVAYMRSRRIATKYGPFACLWARHVKKNTYEFLMIKSDGTLAWHYLGHGWYKNIDPVLGNSLAICYRSDLRQLGYESYPCGGWFPCYPALVATRMVGLRRRNPVDWAEVKRSTPDLSDTLIDQFFSQTPSPLEPPKEFQETPIVELPKRKTIPW